MFCFLEGSKANFVVLAGISFKGTAAPLMIEAKMLFFMGVF